MIVVDDFIMLGRTFPQDTKNSGVTVCSAGYSETMRSFIRIYPIPITQKVPKYSVCTVELCRGSDVRRESFKLWDENKSLKVIRKLSKKEQAQLLDRLFSIRSKSINHLNQCRASLGVITPSLINGNWKGKVTKNDKPLFDMPEVPLLQIKNEDNSPNNLQLREWGACEFIRKFILTGKYEKDELWDALNFDKPQMLLVGNMQNHRNAWLTIATFPYKKARQTCRIQKTLF